MLTKLLIAALLLGHAGIHASFVAPRPPATAGGPEWPFDLGRSWLLGPLGMDSGLVRILGSGFVAATLAGFALAALATVGLLPAGLWSPGVAIGSVASLALLCLFFHPWLVLGVAIDLVMLWAVLIQSWTPEHLAT